jgi:hypothetical protein
MFQIRRRATFGVGEVAWELEERFLSEISIAGILRSAWSTFRLDAIRPAVQQTIGDLEALAAGQVLGREPSRSELEAETGSLCAALDACCDELREGCGLPTSPERAVQVQSMRAADAGWTESFSKALEAYRSAACKGLDASLGALVLPPERPAVALDTL